MTSTNINPIILILRPRQQWALVSAELRRVEALGRYMETKGMVRSEHLTADRQKEHLTADRQKEHLADDSQKELRQIATLCEELLPESLYARYANKKMFRRQIDFWESDDATLRQHVKRMADQRLLQAVRIAASLDIPILYAPTEQTALHIDDRLILEDTTQVTPVMHFQRHDSGTSYKLTLRREAGTELANVITPAEHRLVVLCHEPGLFILDNHLLLLGEGFSGKLLIPFSSKTTVEIPQRMENDYFRRFILKNVSKAEVVATGFDIEDTGLQLCPCLVVEQTLSGDHILALHFRYSDLDYTPDSKSHGKVQLQETEDGFRFIRSRRNKQAEQQALDALRRECSLSTSISASSSTNGWLRFDTTATMIDWLRQHGPQLRQQGIEVVQPSEQVYYIGPLSIEQSDTWNGDWLQTDVTVVLDNGRLRLPFRDLRATILRGEQDYMLPTGERLLIPQEWLQRYGDLLLTGQPSGKGFRRHRSQLSEEGKVKSEKFATATETTATETTATKTTAAANSSLLTIHSSLKAPAALRATLRPYQQAGYEWLWNNFEAQTGCCLSDEMGLGKTVQTIALLLKYKETAKVVTPTTAVPGMLFSEEEMKGESQCSMFNVQSSIPFHTSLVVAPASVVHNWINELRRFAPSLLACNYTGDAATRRDKRQALLRWDVVVTTYQTLRTDIEHFAPLQFGIVVFDESQAFKTHSSKVHHAVSRLTSLHRMALSGTPVENNLHELWSLMSVLNPNLLGSLRSFQQLFIAPVATQMEQQRTDLLQRLIAPYFLKRTKEEVLSDLPERQDEVVVCPMTDSQASRYAVELSKARNEWLELRVKSSELSDVSSKKQDSQSSTLNVLAAIQRLRQIANGEGKMEVVFERLESLRGTRHKVLLFSEYVTLLKHVGDMMTQRGWSYALLTGETQRREQVIDRFQGDADCQFFLISLKAGGLGLNLTAADYVFLLDPWWNVAAEEQAIARSHRIGQHRPVFVYRFVSENTLEQQILTLQERKQTLIDSVMPFICNR